MFVIMTFSLRLKLFFFTMMSGHFCCMSIMRCIQVIWSAFLRFLNKWIDLDLKRACHTSLTQISPDTLLRLESMCILCVLAAVWPHTCTIRYCYLLWYMIRWTGPTFTKANLLFLHISLINDRVQSVMNRVVETSDPIPTVSVSIIEANSFPLGWSECCHMYRAIVGYCVNLFDHKWAWKSS